MMRPVPLLLAERSLRCRRRCIRGSLAELKALTKGEFDETGILYLVRILPGIRTLVSLCLPHRQPHPPAACVAEQPAHRASALAFLHCALRLHITGRPRLQRPEQTQPRRVADGGDHPRTGTGGAEPGGAAQFSRGSHSLPSCRPLARAPLFASGLVCLFHRKRHCLHFVFAQVTMQLSVGYRALQEELQQTEDLLRKEQARLLTIPHLSSEGSASLRVVERGHRRSQADFHESQRRPLIVVPIPQNKKQAGGGASWRLKEALHERERARHHDDSPLILSSC